MENNTEKTVINMEFVDTEEEQEQEQTDLTPVEKTEAQPGKFRKFVRKATAPARWLGRKIKESPASAAVFTVLGAAIGLGGKAAYDHFNRKGSDGFIPADPPEIEIPDDGEEYVSTASYEDTEE